jgi:hypothetical protein
MCAQSAQHASNATTHTLSPPVPTQCRRETPQPPSATTSLLCCAVEFETMFLPRRLLATSCRIRSATLVVASTHRLSSRRTDARPIARAVCNAPSRRSPSACRRTRSPWWRRTASESCRTTFPTSFVSPRPFSTSPAFSSPTQCSCSRPTPLARWLLHCFRSASRCHT